MPRQTQATPAERARYERLAGVETDEHLTVHRLCLRYLAFCETYYSPRPGEANNETRNVRAALRPVKRLYGTETADSLTASRLRAVRECMIESGWARTTVNARVNVIKRMYRWAAERELVPAETWHSLQSVRSLPKHRTRAPEPSPVTPISEAAFWQTVKSAPAVVAAMMELQWWTAMRPGEVVGMAGESVTNAAVAPTHGCDAAIVENGFARGTHSFTYPVTYRPPTHKNDWRGHDRIIYLGPRAQVVLRGWLRPGPCFVTARGNPWSVNSYSNAVAKTAQAAGLDPWRPNRIRHAAATRIARELGDETARLLLGHRDIDTTQIYIERNRSAAVEAAARVG